MMYYFYRRKISYKIFNACNVVFLSAVTIICILPLIHILAVSFSGEAPANANIVKLWPLDFNTDSYINVINDAKLHRAFMVSVQRVLLGLVINMLLTCLTAYPLSFDSKKFPLRGVYVWFFVFTMLFSGGLIPYYILVRQLGLINSIWVLILPGIPIFNVILLMNFFRQLPKELYETSTIDGAQHWTVLLRIYLPLSLPAIATLTLFSIVAHWNSWFDGMIFITDTKNIPLMTYIRNLIINTNEPVSLDEARRLAYLSRRSVLSAKLIVAILPILLVYPYLQKYYKTGLVIGSVKG